MDWLLWRDAQQVLDRHAQAGPDGRCEWCGWHWPCPPLRLAERAEVAASRPWRVAWTAGAFRIVEPAIEEAPARAAPAHAWRPSGRFD